MNRRQFLILGGVSTTALVVGSAAYRIGAVWWDQTPHEDFDVLSAREVEIAEAIADAMFPGDHLGMPNGTEVGVLSTFDRYLEAIHPQKANLLRLLLHAIDEMAIFDGLAMVPFRKRPRKQRIAILNRWDDAGLNARKEAFLGLKVIFSMGYCESPEVMERAGIEYECGGLS